MSFDIQVIFDSIANIFMIAFPISIILCLLAKITNFFTSFVFGGKEIKL